MARQNDRIVAALQRCRGTLSKSAFARRLGVRRQTVQHWFEGASRPEIRNYTALLEAFPDCADDLRKAFCDKPGEGSH